MRSFVGTGGQADGKIHASHAMPAAAPAAPGDEDAD